MRQEWDDFRTALSFLTIIPVGKDLAPEPDRLARSMGFFPAVGLVIGLGLVVLNWLLDGLLPRPVLDCLLILFMITITGALHLDGIADLIDGLAGGKDKAGILAIMKDSRVGAIGVVGLIMVLLLKYLSLFNLDPDLKSAALIMTPAAGRWVQVILANYCRYLRPQGGTGAVFVELVGEREVMIATGTLIAAALVLFGLNGIFLVFLFGIVAMLLMRYFQSRLGGVTGDVLGAATEIIEVLSLLFILALI
ncbi:MAG: adenosylcobinamide-GDP ribazoletransferase [Desulfuromonadales bacterium]|nr:adenosylcobinamide-GDP ribazoletransferase [Desulfuromonadales bacterium]